MNRIQSVDIFRLLGIVAVIAIHTSPFMLDSPSENELYKYLSVIINQLARFAVPFFFVISGYFWGAKVRNGSSPISSALKMSSRILVLFLAWCIVYLIPYNSVFTAFYDHGVLGPIKVVYWNISELIQHPLTLIMQGTKVHLWFLIGLIFSIGISAIFIHKQWIKSLIFLSLLLYVIGVLAKAYTNTPIGITIEFNTRNGPFFGTLFFVSGYLMSGFTANAKWLNYGILVFLLGCIAHFSEIYVLWSMYGTSPKQDFVLGTYFMGVGVAMASLSNHPALQNKMLSKIGQMTLGIYAVHFIYVDLFRGIDENIYSPFWEMSYVMLVLVLSVLSSILLSKNKITRKLVVVESGSRGFFSPGSLPRMA
ncbi:MAG: acyltransferase [Deltaproteobacteria bacterium]|nr:acyltransferase [Deltaproteobacteria bacterium]